MNRLAAGTAQRQDQEREQDGRTGRWQQLAGLLVGNRPPFPGPEQLAAVHEAARLLRGGVPVPRQVRVGPEQVLTLPESVLGGGVHVNVRAAVVFVVRPAPPLSAPSARRTRPKSFTPAEIEEFVQLVRAQGLHVTAVKHAPAHPILRVHIDPADVTPAPLRHDSDHGPGLDA